MRKPKDDPARLAQIRALLAEGKTSRQIGAVLGVHRKRVRQLIRGDRPPEHSKDGHYLPAENPIRESAAAAAHWAGVTFEDYQMHPMRRTSQVMQPTWVPSGSSAA